MLTKGFIVLQPYSIMELALSADNKELIVGQVAPAVRGVRAYDQGVDGKGLDPSNNVLYLPMTVFLWGCDC